MAISRWSLGKNLKRWSFEYGQFCFESGVGSLSDDEDDAIDCSSKVALGGDGRSLISEGIVLM
jgi:hypothetical protein